MSVENPAKESGLPAVAGVRSSEATSRPGDSQETGGEGARPSPQPSPGRGEDTAGRGGSKAGPSPQPSPVGRGGSNLTNSPKEPPRDPSPGFLVVPPYRVHGVSIAGEESVVQIPELGICFDIGRCPRFALTSEFVALTHGHMDHAAGIAYYFSQRVFQGMTPGTLICHPALEQPIHNIMYAWIDVEAQRTPYKVIGLPPEGELEIKRNLYLRAFATRHTVPSLGFVVLEKRSKLKAELAGLPQEKLVALKNKGQEITHTIEAPLVCYTGDTMWGPHFDRPDVLNAKILITECTFQEPDHRSRAMVGQHMHLDDIIKLLAKSKAQAVILTHLSRRTQAAEAKREIMDALSPEDRGRVHVLMECRPPRRSGPRRIEPPPPPPPAPEI